MSIDGPAHVDEQVTVQFSDAYDPSPIGPGADFHYAFATDPTALPVRRTRTAVRHPSASFTFSTAGQQTVYGRVIAQDNDYNDYATQFAVYYQPGTLVVVNTDDSGTGSLRDAVDNSSPGSLIVFDSSLRGQTITLTSGELVVDKDLDIEGLGASVLTVARSGDPGTPDFRIFTVAVGCQRPSLDGLTITGGRADRRRRHLQRRHADDHRLHHQRQRLGALHVARARHPASAGTRRRGSPTPAR